MILESASRHETHEPCLTDYVEGLFHARDDRECLTDLAVREVARALEAYATIEGQGIVETTSLAAMTSSAVKALGRDDLAVEAFIIGSRVVYPQKLTCVEDGPVWVINTEKVFPDIPGCTELGFFSVLYHLLGSMVHLWDVDAGKGALGIRKLRSVAALFAGGAGRKGVEPWIDEIKQAVSDRLLQCSSGRNWTSSPSVLMLD